MLLDTWVVAASTTEGHRSLPLLAGDISVIEHCLFCHFRKGQKIGRQNGSEITGGFGYGRIIEVDINLYLYCHCSVLLWGNICTAFQNSPNRIYEARLCDWSAK